jgi:hypothetical protein
MKMHTRTKQDGPSIVKEAEAFIDSNSDRVVISSTYLAPYSAPSLSAAQAIVREDAFFKRLSTDRE